MSRPVVSRAPEERPARSRAGGRAVSPIPRGFTGGLSWLPIAGLLLAMLPGAAPARAATHTLHLDPAASQVTFSLGSTFHDVHGSFQMKEGVIHYDPETGEASGNIRVSTASGESGNESRDEKMHEKVLESDKYPDIVFTPRRLTGSFDPERGGEVELEGTIELHGVTKEITISGEVEIAGDHLTGTAGMTIPYVEWGMKDPSVFIFRAGKTVDIHLDLEGSIERTRS